MLVHCPASPPGRAPRS